MKRKSGNLPRMESYTSEGSKWRKVKYIIDLTDRLLPFIGESYFFTKNQEVF